MRFILLVIFVLLIMPVLQAQKFYPFSDGKKWGFVDRNQKIVIQPVFDSVLFPHNRNNHLVVINNHKQALYDKSGKALTPFDYDAIDHSLSSNLDYLYVVVNGKYGFIDSLGNLICKPKYDRVYSFDKNGLCRVMLNNKWGLINRTGKEVLKPTYDAIHFYSDDGSNTFVTQNEKVAHIDNKGNLLYPPTYEYVWMLEGKTQKYALAKLNGKWGLINSKGKAVYPFELDQLQFEELASDGLPVFSGSKDGRRMYFKGAEVVSQYTSTSMSHNNEVFVREERGGGSMMFYGVNTIVITKAEDHFRVVDTKAQLNLKIEGDYDSVTVVNKKYYYEKGSLVLKVWKNGKVGLVDQFGRIFISVEQDAIDQLNMYPYLLVASRNGRKSITSVGRSPFQTPYDYVYFTCCSGGDSYSAQYIYAVRADGFKGYLNADGASYFPK